MPNKYKVKLAIEPIITYEEPDKAAATVTDKDSLYSSHTGAWDSLESFTDQLAYDMFNARVELRESLTRYDHIKFVEGIGNFVCTSGYDHTMWELEDEDSLKEFGKIVVEFEDGCNLYIDDSAEEM